MRPRGFNGDGFDQGGGIDADGRADATRRGKTRERHTDASARRSPGSA